MDEQLKRNLTIYFMACGTGLCLLALIMLAKELLPLAAGALFSASLIALSLKEQDDG